ncbi:hypothetical protein BAUCODRAFT_28875 [Baudoinia panamericana UAMH 10762]|uniref:Uncharacterized protein n=1 Tax=Baudoinia panamericana (strain UAMH 10762) TaxID=717646 RepID=M2N8S3_BAUPA|nr:uncharacterized protein BAUCODRAFT_28875 [Baudoinia panamericana UAMH 10762]EMD00529.1 hypothetical protein BAUCODRAFT_28875 [Baudoinia panamericana UAMH 10762]
MSAIVHHVVRRGVEAAHRHFTQPSHEQMAQLQHDAELYEQTGQEVSPMEFLPVVITVIVTLLLIASIRYTVGEVMASLAMIESPSSTAIIEPKPPAYSDEQPPAYAEEADAPLEKKPLDEDVDVEVTVISHKPITSKITNTIGLLQRVGGFSARWRGLGLSIFYHFLHAALSNFLAAMFGGFAAHIPAYIIVSIGLMRVHMVWTHTMISGPTTKSWWQRVVPRKQCRVLFLPTLCLAVAQQATFLLPVAVAFVLLPRDFDHAAAMHQMKHGECGENISLALRFLAVPATALFVAVAVLLPAAATLTRIEATLLPEDQETIVPFDKQAIIGDIDMTVCGSSRVLFVQAWRSFDRSARLRVIKLYAKMVLAQATVAVIGLHLMVAELYLMGGERLVIFFKSAAAQVKLMAIEAHQQAVEASVSQ